MNQSLRHRVAIVGAAVLVAACGTSKSSNPLSPTVAGPIPGVNISAPKLVDPGAGTKIPVGQQPLTLTVENATTNGQRPLKYVFEVAMDAGFTNKVFSKGDITPGDGKTSVRLPDPLAAGRTYYWRAQALDGANTGPYASPANFDVYTPVVIDAPVPVSPVGGAVITSLRPTCVTKNAGRSGPAGAISYTFQIADNESFGAAIAVVTVAEGSSQTQFTLAQELANSKTYYWRVRAFDANVTGGWSATQYFATPAAAPTPPPNPPPGPGPSPGDNLDLGTVVIVKGPANFSSWSATSQISSVTTNGGQLCIQHSMLGKWPSTIFFDDPNTLVEGNQWVFAFINGRWYGGAADWYRPGQACKGVDAASIGRDAFYDPRDEPLHSWVPRPGEQVGFASSTPARAWPDMRTLDQRTNTVIVPWRD